MASRFYNCICGEFATIDMFAWIEGHQAIECNCGRKLNVNDSLLGFSLETAHYAWDEYMKEEFLKESLKRRLTGWQEALKAMDKNKIVELLQSIKILTTGKFTVVIRKEEYDKIGQAVQELMKKPNG